VAEAESCSNAESWVPPAVSTEALTRIIKNFNVTVKNILDFFSYSVSNYDKIISIATYKPVQNYALTTKNTVQTVMPSGSTAFNHNNVI